MRSEVQVLLDPPTFTFATQIECAWEADCLQSAARTTGKRTGRNWSCQSLSRSAQVSHRENYWGVSSAGRAPALQAGGHRFDPDTLHQAFLAERLTQFDHQAFVECLIIQLDGVARNWLCQSHQQLGELRCNSPELTSFREIHISFMLSRAVRSVLGFDPDA